MIRTTVAVAAMIFVSQSVLADEQMTTLASGGNWVARAHSPSMLAPADTCLAYNTGASKMLIFRADREGKEVRFSDDNWSLPSKVSGYISLRVGALFKSYAITGNMSRTVIANIPNSDIIELFGEMDNASRISVTVGKAEPVNIPLSGSTRATNAFRTCARLPGNAASPGSSPF